MLEPKEKLVGTRKRREGKEIRVGFRIKVL